ncbi:MAG: dCMP deaminase family protein [Desulfobulbaceae bacterium]|nr:dCMP deaminase family protein [Desulfobulbaceae bacterium]
MTKPEDRPSWSQYFLSITELVAQRSTCTRRKVGAILVRDKRIIATGYNGAPTKVKHCLEVGCLREQQNIPSGERHELCRGLHAEQNAIIQAALHGVTVENAIVYCTNMPCAICSKMLINARVKEIYYKDGYPDFLASSMLAEAGIPLIQMDEKGDMHKN